MLVEVGPHLLTVTHSGQLVNRLGAEFLVVTPDATPAALTQLIYTVYATIQRSYFTVDSDISVEAASAPPSATLATNALLVEQADHHAYAIKPPPEDAAGHPKGP